MLLSKVIFAKLMSTKAHITTISRSSCSLFIITSYQVIQVVCWSYSGITLCLGGCAHANSQPAHARRIYVDTTSCN